jgi:hypothetical protein
LAGLALAAPGLLFLTYYVHVLDRSSWFYNFRAVPGTELFGAGIAFLAGVFQARLEPETLGEKLLFPAGAIVLITIPFIKPLLGPVDVSKLADRCEGEVCMQSTPSTCGPASAATLLHFFGLTGSERDLAIEALTYQGGTENWYLIRALRRRGLNVNVKILEPGNVFPTPTIAGVVLPGGAEHFVAILDQSGEELTLADPLKGKIVIQKKLAADYYRFTGFFLEVHTGTRKT